MYDMHSHILPNMDDGSSSVEMSLEMLRALREQGVEKVLLTPHFYAYRTDIDAFLEKRKKSIKCLLDALKETPIDISLYVGAEVLYFDDIWCAENVDKLVIEGTKYIMVEFPFSPFNDFMMDRISRLISKGYTPIIAHIDRYLRYNRGLGYFYKLAEMGTLLQMNVSSAMSFASRIKLMPLIKKGLISVLGTDAHNMTERKPDYGETLPYMKKIFTEQSYQYVLNRQAKILENAIKIY